MPGTLILIAHPRLVDPRRKPQMAGLTRTSCLRWMGPAAPAGPWTCSAGSAWHRGGNTKLAESSRRWRQPRPLLPQHFMQRQIPRDEPMLAMKLLYRIDDQGRLRAPGRGCSRSYRTSRRRLSCLAAFPNGVGVRSCQTTTSMVLGRGHPACRSKSTATSFGTCRPRFPALVQPPERTTGVRDSSGHTWTSMVLSTAHATALAPPPMITPCYPGPSRSHIAGWAQICRPVKTFSPDTCLPWVPRGSIARLPLEPLASRGVLSGVRARKEPRQ
jgi:hypothetical protein